MTSSPASHHSGAESSIEKPFNPTSSNLAFLVHSPHTLTLNLPPDVDNKLLARQKRRRTSPEDQKILEHEFQLNPRPDKQTRIDIVSKVGLGEKEVQIWFQNRRQNTKKKARLSDTTSSDDTESSVFITMTDSTESVPSRPASQNSTANSFETIGLVQSSAIPDPLSQSFVSSQGSVTTGYIANRRSIIDREDAQDDITVSQSTSIQQRFQPFPPARKSPTLLRSQSSNLRLSLVDGQAKIVDHNAATPSPEKPKSSIETTTPLMIPLPSATVLPRSGSLRRSYSAAGFHDNVPLVASPSLEPSSRKIPRVTGMSGRSRDSRTWEFWCDSESRNSLVDMAEKETSGSAAEAIGLLRSKGRDSGKLALKVNVAKLNSFHAGHSSTPTNAQSDTSKPRPPLRKSMTAMGLMSTKTKPKPKPKTKAPTQSPSDTSDFEHLNGESDKENADPAPSSQRAPRTGAFERKTTQVLAENETVLSTGSSLGALMAREKQKHAQQAQVRLGKQSSSSSSSAKGEQSPVQEEVLECVEGLLQMAQSQWR